MSSNGFIPHITLATRTTDTSMSIIDIYSNISPTYYFRNRSQIDFSIAHTTEDEILKITSYIIYLLIL